MEDGAYESLMGYARTFGICRADAEDVVQNAYLSLAKKTATSGPVSYPRAYLGKCVTREAGRVKRRRYQRKEQSLGQIAEPACDGKLSDRMLEKLLLAIELLPERQRAIVRALVNGHDDADVWRILHISRATYYKEKALARLALSQFLGID